MRIVIRSSSLIFSVLGIILQAPVTKVRKKKDASEENDHSGANNTTEQDEPKQEN
jgi:hypothetical protein